MAKDKRSKAIRKTIRKAQDSTSAANRSTQVAERLALAAKSSEMLSSVWTLPPAQLLRFHSGMLLTELDAGATPGFEGARTTVNASTSSAPAKSHATSG